MKNLVLLGAFATVLGACAPEVPDSGVGFDNYSTFEADRARREAALAGRSTVIPSPFDAPAQTAPDQMATGLAPPPGGAIATSELRAAGIGGSTFGAPPVLASGADLNRTQGLQASPANAPPVMAGSAGLSDEQSFDAVASRETIESDAERLARQAAAYQVVQPTALPERGNSGPNIVEYALSAPNQKGQPYYSRFVFSGEGRFQRNCASYRSPDEAQRDFLARGGPDRDPRGIDPDGDGFACGWDPAPFRTAVSGN